MSRSSVAVVIAAFDEAATIAGVVRRSRPYAARVIVVDDGSRDGTAARASAAGAEVLRHPARRGKGAAVRAGMQLAFAARETAAVVLLDGDGQHAPEEMPRLLAAFGRGAELVLGDRSSSWAAAPRLRRWTNVAMTALLEGLLPWPVADSQCGYRLVGRRLFERWALSADHFEIETEMLFAAAAAGAAVREVAVSSLYPVSATTGARSPRRSRIRAVPDALRFARCIWMRARRAPVAHSPVICGPRHSPETSCG